MASYGNNDFGADELQVILRKAREFIGKNGSLLWKLVAAFVVLLVLGTAYYQVEPDEVAVVTRFGRFTRIANPGPHMQWPLGLERVQKVPVERQLKQEFGFRTFRDSDQTSFRKDEKTSAEALMLTGDLNVATVEWIVQYKIADPYKYLFKLRDVEETFRLMVEASMRQVVGDHSVTELLTVGREAIASKAKDLLQHLCKLYDNGIMVQQLVLQDVDPPEPVKPSFNEVNQAIQERERAINEAWAEYNQEIPRARGRAEQALQAAEGYAVDRVNRAQGDAQRFVALHDQYQKAPEVTRTRLHLETMSEVLPRAGKKLILDENTKGLLPMFQLDRASTVPAAGAAVSEVQP